MATSDGGVVFKKGDRVLVIADGGSGARIGDVGVCVEHSNAPWICFDNPIEGGAYLRRPKDIAPEDWHHGYMDCVAGCDLQLLARGAALLAARGGA